MNFIRTLLVLALAASSLTVMAESVLYRGVFGEPESLDPDRSGPAAAIPILNDLFVGLTSYDARGKVAAGAAESWEVSDDGLTWRFKLRPGLKWSDGHALTAEDFVFSFRRAVTPATAATTADRLLLLRNAQAILNGEADPSTLGVSAPDPDAPRHALERWGPAWSQPGRMVSNGAYVLAERQPGESIRVTRNPYFYAADEVRIDSSIYVMSDNVDTQVNRFRTGELQINRNPGFAPNRKSFLEDKLGSAVRVTPYPLLVFLRLNLRREPFNNLDVRRALALAIDRDKIARLVLRSGEQPAYNLVPPMISGYEPATSLLNEDNAEMRLATARRLMEAAGYSKERPLTFSMRFTAGWARPTCIAIAAMWREIGVRVELESSEAKSMIADLLRGDFDVAYDGALHEIPEQFLNILQTGTTYNTGAYSSEAFDAALAAAKLEPDAQVRNRLLREAETIALADFPLLPVIYSVSRNLVAPSVRGWHPNPMDVHLTRYLRLEE
jgi:oligopeptide transport system substrate-binding protein